jgi:transposase-like protein
MTETTSMTKKSKKPSTPKLFPDELIDQLLAQVQNKDAESILGESGLAGLLKKQLAERMLAAELTHHLTAEAEQGKAGNHRNGTSPKTVLTPNGELNLDIPRDRQATFEPQLVGKYQRRLPGFDDHVISMYARGMSVREIQGHLLELYGLQVSPDLISTVTDEVLAEVEQWQQRPLEAMYPIVYFDALRLKIRDEGTVKNKAVYLALGIRADGRKEVLGLWIEQTEGAKFWLKVFNELKNRGLHDILIAVVDGLRGFPEAIEAVYPAAQIQTCIVHLIRNSLNLASWKDRKPLAAALKPIYQAATAEAAAAALEAFSQSDWGRKFPTVAAMWQRQWEQVIPVLRLSARSASDYIYDQRHREHAHAAAQDRQQPRPLPQRRSRQQAAVSGLAQHRKGLEDAAYHLAASGQSVRHSVRRAVHQRHQLRLFTATSAHEIPDTSERRSIMEKLYPKVRSHSV